MSIKPIAAALLCCQLAQAAPAQVRVSDTLGEALERALAELQHLRNEKKISDSEIATLKEQAAQLAALVETERQQVQALKDATAARTQANELDTKRVERYEQILALDTQLIDRYQKEVESLRRQRGFSLNLKSGFVLVVVAVVAAALGAMANQ